MCDDVTHISREFRELCEEAIMGGHPVAELDPAQRAANNLSTDLFKKKQNYDELLEKIEALHDESKTVTDQHGEGGRSVREMQKIIHRDENEKEELQYVLDKLQMQVEEEQCNRDDVREQYLSAEKPVLLLQSEKEEMKHNYDELLEKIEALHDGKKIVIGQHGEGGRSVHEMQKIIRRVEIKKEELQYVLDELQMQVKEEQRNRDDVREVGSPASGLGEEVVRVLTSAPRVRVLTHGKSHRVLES
uniref:Smr domain-containing protein n=1 Tax=Steinernema glaseri TaxID=37863 RepID=A0A1I7Y234_9BILA